MKLTANNKVVNSDYELAPNDEIRIRPLMEEINNQNIEFKYLITMNYPYRTTDYTKVMKDSVHLRHVIRRNFGWGTKLFITNEKHTCSRNIINELDASIILGETPTVNQLTPVLSVLSINTLVVASVPVFKILTL